MSSVQFYLFSGSNPGSQFKTINSQNLRLHDECSPLYQLCKPIPKHLKFLSTALLVVSKMPCPQGVDKPLAICLRALLVTESGS